MWSVLHFFFFFGPKSTRSPSPPSSHPTPSTFTPTLPPSTTSLASKYSYPFTPSAPHHTFHYTFHRQTPLRRVRARDMDSSCPQGRAPSCQQIRGASQGTVHGQGSNGTCIFSFWLSKLVRAGLLYKRPDGSDFVGLHVIVQASHDPLI